MFLGFLGQPVVQIWPNLGYKFVRLSCRDTKHKPCCQSLWPTALDNKVINTFILQRRVFNQQLPYQVHFTQALEVLKWKIIFRTSEIDIPSILKAEEGSRTSLLSQLKVVLGSASLLSQLKALFKDAGSLSHFIPPWFDCGGEWCQRGGGKFLVCTWTKVNQECHYGGELYWSMK